MTEPKSPSSADRSKGANRPLDVGLGDEDALSSAREETITLLSECFARDVLTVEEFERRAELVHGARTVPELGAAIEGIRTDALPARAGSAAAAAARSRRFARPPEPAASPGDYDRAIAVFGETKREGSWIPARRNTVVAAMGSAVIDLREAHLGPGQTVVSAFAFMGAVEVIVPPGVHVECSGSAIFGAFERRKEYAAALVAPDAPVVRVVGFAMFGGVEVEQRMAGESRRDAKRRRKRERREVKRLSKSERKELKRLRRGKR